MVYIIRYYLCKSNVFTRFIYNLPKINECKLNVLTELLVLECKRAGCVTAFRGGGGEPPRAKGLCGVSPAWPLPQESVTQPALEYVFIHF